MSDEIKIKVPKINLKKIKKNPWIITTIILGILVIIALLNNGFALGVGKNKIGDTLLDYYQANGVEGLTLDSVEKISGLYQINFKFEGKVIPMFATKDGKYIAQNLMPLILENDEPEEPASQNIPKSDKPKVELFVMSFCPYGNRAEETMLPVYNLLKDKVDWNINYIVSVSGDSIRSLHGQPETDQNIREVCVKNEYGLDKFWDFVSYINNNCGSDGSCWETGANQLGIDTNKIQSCFDSQGIDLMKTEAQISGDAGASGSPTLLINGVKSSAVYKYENPEAYKQAICNAFNDAPGECDETLEGSSAGAGAGGSC